MVTSNGIILEAITLNTPDELAVLEIHPYTVALTEEGEPLEYVVLVQLSEPPAPPPGAYLAGPAYNLLPQGASFHPAIQLILKYDAASLPKLAAAEDLAIASCEAEGTWVELESTVDAEASTVKAEVRRFSKFVILARVDTERQDAGSSGLSSPPADFGWSAIGGIIAAAMALGLLAGLYMTRKRRGRQHASGRIRDDP